MTKEGFNDDRFEEIQVLGSGLTGSVYLVKDRKYSGKLVALKTLENTKDLSLKMEERFIIVIFQFIINFTVNEHQLRIKTYLEPVRDTGCGR